MCFCCIVTKYSFIEYCRANIFALNISVKYFDWKINRRQWSEFKWTWWQQHVYKSCCLFKDLITGSSTLFPKCCLLSIAPGSYRTRCLIWHSYNLRQQNMTIVTLCKTVYNQRSWSLVIILLWNFHLVKAQQTQCNLRSTRYEIKNRIGFWNFKDLCVCVCV